MELRHSEMRDYSECPKGATFEEECACLKKAFTIEIKLV